MQRRDTRHLSKEQQEELRRRVVEMVVRRKMTVTGAARALGVSRWHANRCVQLYRKHGSQALKQARRGRQPGSKRQLTPSQERKIQELTTHKTPEEIGLPYPLWTRQAVSDLIERRYKLRLPVRTMGEYLRRWGYAPQRPLRRAYEQDKKAVQRWVKRESAPKMLADGASPQGERPLLSLTQAIE
jgi:transposase